MLKGSLWQGPGKQVHKLSVEGGSIYALESDGISMNSLT